MFLWLSYSLMIELIKRAPLPVLFHVSDGLMDKFTSCLSTHRSPLSNQKMDVGVHAAC